jgi:hypothetical protein
MSDKNIEFFIINPKYPIEENTQDTYLYYLNEAFLKLMEEMYIPDPQDIVKDSDFILCINCEGENDKIEIENFEYTFLKSKFFDFKSYNIKSNLYSYYNPKGIKVNKLFRDDDHYFIELKTYNT